MIVFWISLTGQNFYVIFYFLLFPIGCLILFTPQWAALDEHFFLNLIYIMGPIILSLRRTLKAWYMTVVYSFSSVSFECFFLFYFPRLFNFFFFLLVSPSILYSFVFLDVTFIIILSCVFLLLIFLSLFLCFFLSFFLSFFLQLLFLPHFILNFPLYSQQSIKFHFSFLFVLFPSLIFTLCLILFYDCHRGFNNIFLFLYSWCVTLLSF